MNEHIDRRINELEIQINNVKNSNENYNKFIAYLGISGVAIMLTAFLLTLIGVVDLRIVNNIYVSKFTQLTISTFLLMCNLFFIIKLSNSNKVFCHLLFSFIVIIASSFIGGNIVYFVQSILLPIVLIALITLQTKDYNRIKLIILINLIVIITQQVLSFIKIGYFKFNFENISIFTSTLFSIDLYLTYIFLLKGILIYGYLLEYLVSTKSKSVQEHSETLQEIAQDLTQGQRVKFFALAMGYQFAQLFIVLGIGLIHNLFIELIIMLINFWLGRKILGNCWHSEKLWICSAMTFISFYVLVKITPPLEISLFLCLVTSGAFTYILYYMGTKADRLETLEEQEEKRQMLTVENIINVMAECHTPQKYHSYLIATICNGIKDTDYFADESVRLLNIDEQQFRNHKTKFKKELKRRKIL